MFDPEEFFRFAAKALRTWDDEASHRSVCGRAYYACFLVARDRMFGTDGIGLTKPLMKRILNRGPGGIHEAVLRAVLQHRGLTLGRAKNLSDQLGQLKDMRVQADYYCDPRQKGTVTLFARYGVTGWDGVAHGAMSLASMLLPSLRQLQGWR